jgi:hypothetical protein
MYKSKGKIMEMTISQINLAIQIKKSLFLVIKKVEALPINRKTRLVECESTSILINNLEMAPMLMLTQV